jgi:hypothetical protein
MRSVPLTSRCAQLKSQFQARFSAVGAPVLDVSALALQIRTGDVGVRVLRSGFGRSLRLLKSGVSNVLEASCPRDMVESLFPSTATIESVVALDAAQQRLRDAAAYVTAQLAVAEPKVAQLKALLQTLPSEVQLRSTLLQSLQLLSKGVSASCASLGTADMSTGEFTYMQSASTDTVLRPYQDASTNTLDGLLQKFNSATMPGSAACPPLHARVGARCEDLKALISMNRRRQTPTVDDVKNSLNQLLPSFGQMAVTKAGGDSSNVASVCVTANVVKDLVLKKRATLQQAPVGSDSGNATAEILRMCTTVLSARVKNADLEAFRLNKVSLEVLCAGSQAQAVFVLKRTSTVIDLRQQVESLEASIESLKQDRASVNSTLTTLQKCMPTFNPMYPAAYNLLRSTLNACRTVSDAILATGTQGPMGLTISRDAVPLALKRSAAQCKLDLAALRQAALPLKPTVGPECMSITRSSFTCFRRVVHVMTATFPGTKKCDIVDGFRSAVEIYRGIVAVHCRGAVPEFCSAATSASATLVAVLPPIIHGLSEQPTAQGSCSKLYQLQFAFPDSQIGARADQFRSFLELAFSNTSSVDSVFFDFKPVAATAAGPVPAQVEGGDLGDATEVQLTGVDLIDFGPLEELTEAAPPEVEPPATRSAGTRAHAISAAIVASLLWIH